MTFDPKSTREKMRYTQDELAQMLQIPKRTLQDWERKGAPHARLMQLALDHIAGKRYVPDAAPRRPKVELTAQQRSDCAAGFLSVGFTRLPDGQWVERDEIMELPAGATYWETRDRGVWCELRRNASADRMRCADLTGRQGRWRPWQYWTGEEPSDEIISDEISSDA